MTQHDEPAPAPASEPVPAANARQAAVMSSLLVSAVELVVCIAVLIAAGVAWQGVEAAPDDKFAGIEYLIFGVPVAFAAASIAGVIVARIRRLGVWLVYLLPVPLVVMIGFGIAWGLADFLFGAGAVVMLTAFAAGSAIALMGLNVAIAVNWPRAKSRR